MKIYDLCTDQDSLILSLVVTRISENIAFKLGIVIICFGQNIRVALYTSCVY